MKGKTMAKWVINGSGQMPTICEIPDKSGARALLPVWPSAACVNPRAAAAVLLAPSPAVRRLADRQVEGGHVRR